MNIYPSKKLKGLFHISLFVLLSVLFTSCLDSKNDSAPNQSNLMVVNACPWAEDGIVWVYNGSAVNRDSSISYLANSRYYQGLWAGVPIAFYKSGQISTGSPLTAGYAPGNNLPYTVFVAGKGDSSFLVSDKLKKANAGNINLRFVHAAPTFGALDVDINGTKTTGVKFSKGSNPEFKELVADGTTAVSVKVFASGTTTELATLTFTPTTTGVYTVYLAGSKDASAPYGPTLRTIDYTRYATAQ